MRKVDFKKLLKLRLGNRRDSDFDEIIELETTQVQLTEIERNALFVPYFLESEWASASTEPNEERLPLPNEFISEIEGQVMQIQLENHWHDLRKGRYDELVREFDSCEPSIPRAYDLSADYILFKPTPNAAYPIRMRFYQTDTPFNLLTDLQENKILKFASDWLMAASGRVIAAEHLQDDALAQKFDVQLTEAKNRILTLTEAREHSNRTYRMEPK